MAIVNSYISLPEGRVFGPWPGFTLGTAATLQTTSANDWVQGLSCRPWLLAFGKQEPWEECFCQENIMFFPFFNIPVWGLKKEEIHTNPIVNQGSWMLLLGW